MRLESGQMLAQHRLVEKIGEGGMGVVWRAVDTKLDREAAIKVLPESFAADHERLLRFEREAKVLASLNHPGITGIFGLHETDGLHYLAMEYVPGENLADRIARGPIPLEQALELGRQIAEALEAAHELGVVHRDLKPSNIVLTPAGDAKVLDFGLAKAVLGDPASGDVDPALSPTLTSPMTLAGTILGTAAYMSPEQARGGAVDKRADIWAFGCVLLEMLTGRRTFPGDTVSDTLAAVLRAEIDYGSLPKETPSSVRQLLQRCLDREPKTRLRDAGEARIVLADPGEAASAATAAPRERPRTGIIALSALVALLLGLALGRVFSPADEADSPRFTYELDLPEGQLRRGSIALSPDGEKLILNVRRDDGSTELWLRPLDELDARPLPGTEGGRYPFWSPNSENIAFFAHDELLRLSLDGTSPRPICTVEDGLGGSWHPDGTILFGAQGDGVRRVDANGGEAIALTAVQPDEEEHGWPVWLDDGEHFVFLADANTVHAHRLYLARIGSDELHVLKTGVRSSLGFDAQMGMIHVEQNQLLAFPLDVSQRELGNEAALLADGLTPMGTNHHVPFSVSQNGILVTQEGAGGFHMLRTDTNGEVLQSYGEVEAFANPAVSPDGRRVVFEINDTLDERLVWMLDLERGVRTPVSHRNSMSDSGIWSGDGQAVYFDSNVDSTRVWTGYKQTADGGGQPALIGKPEDAVEVAMLDCSSDGTMLLVAHMLSVKNYDLTLGRLDGDGQVVEWSNWTDTPEVMEERGAFSPDGRFIAYMSDVSGRREIYLAPTDGGPKAARWQVSTTGGNEPRFSPDGRHIYYRGLNDRFMAVPFSYVDGTVTLGTPDERFEMLEPDIPYYRNSFDVFPDGSLLVLRAVNVGGAAVKVDTGWRNRGR